MCNAIQDGGRRCPIHQHTSVAAVRLAAQISGLHRPQVESLFRELRRERRNAEPVSVTEQAEGRNALLLHTVHNFSSPTELAVINRQLTLAGTTNEDLDAPTYYAAIEIAGRATERNTRLSTLLGGVAERTGLSLEQVRTRYDAEYADAANHDEDYSNALYQRSIRQGLPYDRASVIALARVELPAPARERRPRVMEEVQAPAGSHLSSYRYDEGRLEVAFRSAPEVFYAYQNVPAALWSRLSTAARPGAIYNNQIRNLREFVYENADAAEEDSYAYRCAACGQFRAAAHNCPERRPVLITGAPSNSHVEVVEDSPAVEVAAPALPTHALHLAVSPFTVAAASNTRESLEAIVGTENFQERLPFGEVRTVTMSDGSERNVIFLGDTLTERNTFLSHNGSMTNRRSSAFTNDFAVRNSPTAAEIAVAIETTDAWKVATTVNTLHFINVVRNNLHEADFDMPVEASFNQLTSPDTGAVLPAAVVSGNVHVGRLVEGQDIENARVLGSNLRCTCAEYVENNYDCIHIRALRRNPFALLANRSSVFTREQTMTNYMNGLPRDIVTRERNIRNAMRDGMSREEAEVFEEGRAERERVEEAERVRLRQIANAERERITLERGRQNAERLLTQNAAVVADNATYREQMIARWQDVEPTYADDHDKFFEDYKNTLRRKRNSEEVLDYKTENVTDGVCGDGPGARKFGIELEFDIAPGTDRRTALRKIAQELHAAGLTEHDYQTEYHSARSSGWGSWSFEEDCTVSGELVSPILSDTPETWAQLQTALEIIKNNGGVATTRTGSHVHVSTASYESSPAKHLELLRQVNSNDELLYRFAADPSRGSHRGMTWCAPNVNDTSDTVAADVSSSHNVLGSHNSHSYGLNFETTYQNNYSHSNVEFRMWDGTLDPAIIQRQVMISAAMTDYAERRVIEQGQSAPSAVPRQRFGAARDNERTLLEGRRTHTRESFEGSLGSAPEMIDNLFRKPEDRLRIAELFSVTSWQKMSYNSHDDDEYGDDGDY